MTEWKSMNGCEDSLSEDDFRFNEKLKDGEIDANNYEEWLLYEEEEDWKDEEYYDYD